MGIYDNDIKRDIAAIYALLNGVKPSCELENPLQQSSTVLQEQVNRLRLNVLR